MCRYLGVNIDIIYTSLNSPIIVRYLGYMTENQSEECYANLYRANILLKTDLVHFDN